MYSMAAGYDESQKPKILYAENLHTSSVRPVKTMCAGREHVGKAKPSSRFHAYSLPS